MDSIIGIDLGTTNSEVAIVRDGEPIVLAEDGDPILPSVVGLDPQGSLLVGRAARNQFVLAADRTIRSIKRKMGQDVKVALGDESFTPQEVSAMILRALKQRAERVLGRPVTKAVITVPALFTESQREATREAGELAGLEVVRIINEPTAAVLTYDPNPPEMERLLVYDLGGGTFDVSVAQVEQGVVEILASHGDTHLGGDDFDQRLLDYVCDGFQTKHGIDLRESLSARSRLLAAVEEAKKRLSVEPVAVVAEEFIAEKHGVPLNLQIEIDRQDYEVLIRPLLAKTLKCVDDAISDAKLQAAQIDKVLLVGGAMRTPLVHQMLAARLGLPVHTEVEPDLAVALGAAVQGALIAGVDVGPVLVDITPHTLGIECIGEVYGLHSPHCFSAIIERNTPLPATRSEMYSTNHDGQTEAKISVYQGEDEDARHNNFVGEFSIQGLADVPSPNQILVRFDLDLNGMLRVTATERATGLAKQVVIDNMMERFRRRGRVDALQRLDNLFQRDRSDTPINAESWTELAPDELAGGPLEEVEQTDIEPNSAEAPSVRSPGADSPETDLHQAIAHARMLMVKSGELESGAAPQDVEEMQLLAADLRSAIDRESVDDIKRISAELENIVFYLAGL